MPNSFDTVDSTDTVVGPEPIAIPAAKAKTGERKTTTQALVQHDSSPMNEKEKQKAKASKRGDREDGKHELQEEEVYDKLGFGFPTHKKWRILSVIFVVQ